MLIGLSEAGFVEQVNVELRDGSQSSTSQHSSATQCFRVQKVVGAVFADVTAW